MKALKEKFNIDLTPQRKEGETFVDYKKRQKTNTFFMKMMKKHNVRTLWDSLRQGTFNRQRGHKLAGEA